MRRRLGRGWFTCLLNLNGACKAAPTNISKYASHLQSTSLFSKAKPITLDKIVFVEKKTCCHFESISLYFINLSLYHTSPPLSGTLPIKSKFDGSTVQAGGAAETRDTGLIGHDTQSNSRYKVIKSEAITHPCHPYGPPIYRNPQDSYQSSYSTFRRDKSTNLQLFPPPYTATNTQTLTLLGGLLPPPPPHHIFQIY